MLTQRKYLIYVDYLTCLSNVSKASFAGFLKLQQLETKNPANRELGAFRVGIGLLLMSF